MIESTYKGIYEKIPHGKNIPYLKSNPNSNLTLT